MTFIEKLDKLMEENNLNKHSLSVQCGIPYTTIDGFYKKGTDNIKLSTLRKLSDFFDCSLDYLADDNVTERNNIETLAAHHEGEDFTEEELEEIERFKEFVRARRNK